MPHSTAGTRWNRRNTVMIFAVPMSNSVLLLTNHDYPAFATGVLFTIPRAAAPGAARGREEYGGAAHAGFLSREAGAEAAIPDPLSLPALHVCMSDVPAGDGLWELSGNAPAPAVGKSGDDAGAD